MPNWTAPRASHVMGSNLATQGRLYIYICWSHNGTSATMNLAMHIYYIYIYTSKELDASVSWRLTHRSRKRELKTDAPQLEIDHACAQQACQYWPSSKNVYLHIYIHDIYLHIYINIYIYIHKYVHYVHYIHIYICLYIIYIYVYIIYLYAIGRFPGPRDL